MKEKTCCVCKLKKDISSFSKDKYTSDGLSCRCKSCDSIRKKKIPKEHTRKVSLQWANKNPLRKWMHGTLSQHKRLGFIVNFSNDEFLKWLERQPKKCNYCGAELNFTHGTKDGKVIKTSPTLDRINNETVLTLENIQLLCHSCNATKQDRGHDEFINYCNELVKKFRR